MPQFHSLSLWFFVLVPCGPGNFQTRVDCSSGFLQLTWDQTYGATGYSASLVATNSGRQIFCNSTSPSCSLSSLTCGESYVARVRSYNGTCFSMLSQPVTFNEGQWTFWVSCEQFFFFFKKAICAIIMWGTRFVYMLYAQGYIWTPQL